MLLGQLNLEGIGVRAKSKSRLSVANRKAAEAANADRYRWMTGFSVARPRSQETKNRVVGNNR